MKPLYEFKDLHVQYGPVKALQGISLQGFPGETLGIVGESGCGKSTLAKALMKLVKPTQGNVTFNGNLQMIFQDPDASLNPRMSVYNHLKEALLVKEKLSEEALDEKIQALLALVELPIELAASYPYQLSGGQKQRISIARALSVEPELIICDEPLASLDTTVSAKILQLLIQLQKEKNLAYLFITHDLISLRALAHTVAVFYLGQLVEYGPCQTLYENPLHPYTQALLTAIPIKDPVLERNRSRVIVHGEIPSIINPPTGCVFHTRCPFATEICRTVRPSLQEIGPSHKLACHLYGREP
jgi:oligopeptide/dipeptide ABC transporter ATP-binding protein